MLSILNECLLHIWKKKLSDIQKKVSTLQFIELRRVELRCWLLHLNTLEQITLYQVRMSACFQKKYLSALMLTPTSASTKVEVVFVTVGFSISVYPKQLSLTTDSSHLSGVF